MRALTFILTLFVGPSSFAQFKCSDVLKQSDPTVWNWITGRESKDYNDQLKHINDVLFRTQSKIPIYKQSPNQSILSLGEGNSDFISSMLKLNPRGIYHAIDAVEGANKRQSESSTFIENEIKYPDNFHISLFQDMDLKAKDGKRLMFDEVISSWSLSPVLREASPKESSVILSRIFLHLKTGGTLRVWPGLKRGLMYKILGKLQAYHGFDFRINTFNDPNLETFILIHKVSESQFRVEANM